MSRTDSQVKIRMPDELKGYLQTFADADRRTLTAEIIHRLDESIRGNPAPSFDRARIAAMALQGLLTLDQGRWELMLEAMHGEAKKLGEKRTVAALVALCAVGYADALIAELERP